jgi:hypothetical protein
VLRANPRAAFVICRPLGLAQPCGAAAGLWVFGHLMDRAEALSADQLLVFGMIEARMIERVAAITADRLAEYRTRVEHQDGVAMRVYSEYGEHRALGVGREVE